MLVLTIIYFLTRLPFLRNLPVFYDSFEYLDIAEKLTISNFSQVVNSSHQPIHTFYFLTVLVFKTIFFFLPANTVLVLISFIFGCLTINVWYLLVRNYFNKRIAFYSSLLILFFPYFFAANTNILYESELFFFQIASLYFTFKGFKEDSSFSIVLGGLFWGISQSIFIGSLIILPVFVRQYISIKKRRTSSLVVFLIVGVITLVVIDLLFLKTSLYFKYRLHLFDFVSGSDGFFVFCLRIIRNIVIQTSAILSVSGAIFLAIALLKIFIKNRQKFIFYSIWLLPVFFLMQYWHAGLFGRLAIFIIFPASLVISLAIERKIIKLFVLLFIALTTINYAIKQRQEPPMYRYNSLIKNSIDLNKTAMITSDYNRFLYFKNKIPTFIFNGLDENIIQAEKFILDNLNQQNKIVVDSSGLRFPYFQFDGDFYHILSLGKIGQSQAKRILNKYNYQLYKVDKLNPEIYFFEISGLSKDKKEPNIEIYYPNVLYKINPNRTYSFDPLVNLFYFLTYKKDPEYWWYEK